MTEPKKKQVRCTVRQLEGEDFLDGTLNEVVASLQEIHHTCSVYGDETGRKGYQDLRFEFDHDQGYDWFRITGSRLETDDEFNRRWPIEQAEARNAECTREQAEQVEREQYERLKKKFG
jgi:hypothetical protein